MEQQNQIFTKRFISLFLTNISVFLVFYGLVTTLPLYAIGTLGRSDDESGLLVTLFLVSAIIVRPFSGKLLDLYGKKRMLVMAIILYLACTVLYLFVKPFLLLLALRFFQGIWFSIITTAAGSLAADIVPENRRGAGLGYFVMSTNLAVVIGPFIAILLVQNAGFDMLFIVLSVIVLIGAGIAMTIKTDDLPEVVLEDRRLKFSFTDMFEKKAIPLGILASLIGFSYSSVLSFLSLYAEQKDLLQMASYFFMVFAASMLITRPFTGKVYDTKGPKFIIIPAFIAFGSGLVLLGMVQSTGVFLCAAVLIGFGYGTLATSFQALAVQSTQKERSGYATATYFTLFDIGLALGSYVFGIIVVSLSYEKAYFLAAALLVFVLALYLMQLKKTNKELVS